MFKMYKPSPTKSGESFIPVLQVSDTTIQCLDKNGNTVFKNTSDFILKKKELKQEFVSVNGMKPTVKTIIPKIIETTNTTETTETVNEPEETNTNDTSEPVDTSGVDDFYGDL